MAHNCNCEMCWEAQKKFKEKKEMKQEQPHWDKGGQIESDISHLPEE